MTYYSLAIDVTLPEILGLVSVLVANLMGTVQNTWVVLRCMCEYASINNLRA